LSEKYSPAHIFLTFLGINLDLQTQFIDAGVRWFITFILFYYIVFFFATRFEKKSIRLFILFFIPTVICAVDVFFDFYKLIPNAGWNPWKRSFLIFPVGCVVGMYYKNISAFFDKLKHRWLHCVVLILIFSVLYCLAEDYLFYGRNLKSMGISQGFYSAVCHQLKYFLVVILFMLIFTLLSSLKVISKYLSFMGFISYEIYLLHAPFLNNFDFVFFRLPAAYDNGNTCPA
jgi:peptidoglycan/LPS O-acetylase OafA/YrhL